MEMIRGENIIIHGSSTFDTFVGQSDFVELPTGPKCYLWKAIRAIK